MIHLGLCTMGTSAACLFRDGELVAAIEEERLSRIKNDGAFPSLSIAACLTMGGVAISEVDAVCVYWKPWRLATRVSGTLGKALRSPAAMKAIGERTFGALFARQTTAHSPEASGRWLDLFFIRKMLSQAFGRFDGDIHFLDHHATHQTYAEAMRDWPTCLSMSFDGGGEADSTVVSVLRDGRRTDLKRIRWPNSLGHFYSFFTGYLGFRMLEGEYKMMGLAPYGKPRYEGLILEKLLKLDADGGYRLDTTLVDYHRALRGDFPAAIASLFGPPRDPADPPAETHLDLAASVQAAFEAALHHVLNWARQRHPEIDRLVLSGGCALNVSANGRILQSGLFREIAVPPAPHDAGCAVGAVLAHLGTRTRGTANPYLGPAFSDDEIAAAFRARGLPEPRRVGEAELVGRVTDTLAARGIVGWFQGRTEFGPRALGARSILADPRDDTIREDINRKIKKRELFRPFAPSTTTEACAEFFELAQDSPYMNILATVRPAKRALIPAVTHVDGTARVHTVSAAANPLYHRLITAFGARTGVPVLLNTSFNIQEPIVNTPDEAIRTFLVSGMDLLAIGNHLADRDWRAQAGTTAGDR